MQYLPIVRTGVDAGQRQDASGAVVAGRYAGARDGGRQNVARRTPGRDRHCCTRHVRVINVRQRQPGLKRHGTAILCIAATAAGAAKHRVVRQRRHRDAACRRGRLRSRSVRVRIRYAERYRTARRRRVVRRIVTTVQERHTA